ncbi:MAG: glycine betaine ABC transporter substrate-binding protein [Alkalispirochaetaceae bacterium]
MRRGRILVTVAIVALSFLLISAGGGEGSSVTVGAKNFTEQYVMGNMISLLLEDAGIPTNQQFGMSSQAVRNALETQQVDIYADYTGTGWLVYLGHDEAINDPAELWEELKAEDESENDIIWFERTPVDNTYALAVKSSFAEENDLETLSDLADLVDDDPEELTFGIGFEFFERPDGFPALTEAYGLDVPEGKVRTMELGLTYDAIDQGDIDVAMVFATDGKLQEFDLVVLDDNESFFTPYNLAICATEELLNEVDGIQEALDPLSDVLTADVMIELNYQVDAEGMEPEEVAREFLVDEGLIEG